MLNICKKTEKKHTNEHRNILRCGVVPQFYDLKVTTLSLTAETISIDSENILLSK